MARVIAKEVPSGLPPRPKPAVGSPSRFETFHGYIPEWLEVAGSKYRFSVQLTYTRKVGGVEGVKETRRYYIGVVPVAYAQIDAASWRVSMGGEHPFGTEKEMHDFIVSELTANAAER